MSLTEDLKDERSETMSSVHSESDALRKRELTDLGQFDDFEAATFPVREEIPLSMQTR